MNPGSQLGASTGNQRKLHSIHGLLRGRIVDGQFEVRGQPYRFSFVPATAALADGGLVLTGRLAVHPPQLSMRFVDGVEARLVALGRCWRVASAPAVADRNSPDEPDVYIGPEDGAGERARD